MSIKSVFPLEMLEDDFQYFELLGSGKFGKVYKVMSKKTGQKHLVYCQQNR